MFDGAGDRWRDEAACLTASSDLFFPTNERKNAGPAKAICATCPVLNECRAWAIEFDVFPLVGIFGGMTTVERELAYRDAEAAGTVPLAS